MKKKGDLSNSEWCCYCRIDLCISQNADVGFFYSHWVFTEWSSSLGENVHLISEKNGSTALNWREVKTATYYISKMQKSISECRTHWTSKQVGGLWQQKTTLDATHVCKEQKSEATILKSSPKLDNRRLKNDFLVSWVSVSTATFRWQQQTTKHPALFKIPQPT